MSKKKFTSGLESLFVEIATEEQGVIAQSGDGERKQGNKDFSSDLAAFLASAFEESLGEQLAQAQTGGAKRENPIAASGLDLLLRSSLSPKSMEIHNQHPTRRITLIFEAEKLEKLKTIARLEQAQVKDIVNDIVAEYIKKYENQKGHLP